MPLKTWIKLISSKNTILEKCVYTLVLEGIWHCCYSCWKSVNSNSLQKCMGIWSAGRMFFSRGCVGGYSVIFSQDWVKNVRHLRCTKIEHNNGNTIWNGCFARFTPAQLLIESRRKGCIGSWKKRCLSRSSLTAKWLRLKVSAQGAGNNNLVWSCKVNVLIHVQQELNIM